MKKLLLVLPLLYATPTMAKGHSITHHVVKLAKRSLPVAVGVVAGEWAYHKFVEAPPPVVIQPQPQEDDEDDHYRHRHVEEDDADDNDHLSYRDRINSGYTGP